MKSSQRATNRKRDKRILLFIYTVKNVFILRYTGIKSMYLYIYCTLLEKLFLYYTVPKTILGLPIKTAPVKAGVDVKVYVFM